MIMKRKASYRIHPVDTTFSFSRFLATSILATVAVFIFSSIAMAMWWEGQGVNGGRLVWEHLKTFIFASAAFGFVYALIDRS
jgi:hypothetical protein